MKSSTLTLLEVLVVRIRTHDYSPWISGFRANSLRHFFYISHRLLFENWKNVRKKHVGLQYLFDCFSVVAKSCDAEKGGHVRIRNTDMKSLFSSRFQDWRFVKNPFAGTVCFPLNIRIFFSRVEGGNINNHDLLIAPAFTCVKSKSATRGKHRGWGRRGSGKCENLRVKIFGYFRVFGKTSRVKLWAFPP